MILTRATAADLPEVLALLNDAAARLHARGISQWPRQFGQDRIGPMVGRGDVLLVRDGGIPAATAAVTAAGDPDFWTARELAEPASYVSKAARAGGYAGLGEMLLRWITDAADARGDRWVRLDAWRDNPGLHAYYARRRWQHVRTVPAPHRNSGALFQRLALPDPPARAAFTSDAGLPPQPAPARQPVVIRTAMGVAYSPSDHGVA
jgi:GNAT superfamily N-acetyltransferase